MKVKELKKILARFPRNAEVAIQVNEHKKNNITVNGQVNEVGEWSVVIKESEENKDSKASDSN